MSERQQGVVKFFINEKSYGFITSKAGENLFVHFKEIQESGFTTLKEGMAVTFVARRGQNGMHATDVRIA
ncbi:cold response protein 1 [Penicillium bovifimosum]|uniref:Cold response protein 1 n=1 Tax=Penicillium bovifimosum TaxID=126998 RepID=A0A9W9GT59_9EURO|nr:cold response protein 1 [Penicillium bovifimosum]KAJ5129466.1 cold response protein 1 [Penicillium bovifimosum]